MQEDNERKNKDSVHHTKKKVKKPFYAQLYTILSIILIVLIIYNIWQVSVISTSFEKKIEEAKLAAIPAKIELAIINTDSCPECFDINTIVNQIEATGVNITEKIILNYSSKTAQTLIEKYSLSKLPGVIVKGEISRSKKLVNVLNKFSQGQEETSNLYIINAPEPPFLDATTGKIKGKVTITYLNKKDCQECQDLMNLIEQLKVVLKVKQFEEVSIGSNEGQELKEKYNISKVPTVILNPETKLYPSINDVWERVGTVEDDGMYIMRSLNPPYYDLEKNKVRGKVTLISLSDKTCNSCYDTLANNKPILQQLGLIFSEEKKLDITEAEAKSLLQKYEITKIPTIILTGDAEAYPNLASIWRKVGTIESDGTHVFRKVELFQQPYKDLEKDEVVTFSEDETD